nr:MAG: antitoxin component [Bacteriophage sp.]
MLLDGSYIVRNQRNNLSGADYRIEKGMRKKRTSQLKEEIKMPAQKITPQIRAQRLLKGAITAQGLTMEKMAKKMGKRTGATISEWCADIYNVKLADVIRLCAVLNIDVEKLLEIQKGA